MIDECVPIDLVTLKGRLSDTRLLEAAGGVEFLVDVGQSVPTWHNAAYYAQQVRSAYYRGEVLSRAQRAFNELSNSRLNGDWFAEASVLVDEVAEAVRGGTSQTKEGRIMPTAITDFGEDEPVPWIWEPFIARASITLLVALWKVGKTTLLSWMLRGLCHGGDIGGAIAPGRAIIVSEEGADLWRSRREEAGLTDAVSLIIRPFKTRPTMSEWVTFLDHLAEIVAEQNIDMVVLDSLASVSPVEDENDASTVQAALMPLHKLTGAGATVLLVHHAKKGDGSQATAARGSGALGGFVDTILELRRFDAIRSDDTCRVLTGYSRYTEVPSETVLELKPDGYRVVGSRADANQAGRSKVLDTMLPTGAPGLTIEELRAGWDADTSGIRTPTKQTIGRDLRKGAKDGYWASEGTGKKGSPLRYYRRQTPDQEAESTELADQCPEFDSERNL
ncbi:MAG: AAA family ATPase [bacterium]|nr:AAA family ATPase [bacterium]